MEFSTASTCHVFAKVCASHKGEFLGFEFAILASSKPATLVVK
jgi:hypothetical protein